MKITRELRGSIDGIQLKRFVPGQIYNVSPSFGSYLLTERLAEAVLEGEAHDTAVESADDRPTRGSRVSD